MTTATRTPSVCPGTGKAVIILAGYLNGRRYARCPVCAQPTQTYQKRGNWFIGTHERREQ